MAGFFENMRVNTQALANTNIETEKNIKGTVLPVLERLHKEIKNKAKELAHGAQKSAREVEKARNTTQKHIELLGQQTAAFESTGGRVAPHEDPYVVRRGVVHRLNRQLLEENNHHNDVVAVQNNFRAFEAHIVQVVHQSMEAFSQLAGGQAERVRALYSDMQGAAQRIPPDFEWERFVARSGSALADPDEAPRTIEGVAFPNQQHASTKPLMEGTLERKSRNKLAWGYQTGYYVVTPARFLHEFRDADDLRRDPTPELSIYLPDAVVGAPSGDKFNIKGRDRSRGLSSKLVGSAELAFKAHTPADAERWFSVIRDVAGATGPAVQAESTPASPTVATDGPADLTHDGKAEEAAAASSSSPATAAQETGVTGTEKPPITATVVSPTSPTDAKTSLPAGSAVSPTSAVAADDAKAAAAPHSATSEKETAVA